MHSRFWIVCDRPRTLKVDDGNRPHCEDGPSHVWADGIALYYWHGVLVPAEWIEHRGSLDPRIALTWDNIEQRRAAAEIIGWDRVLQCVDAREVERDEYGVLLDVDLPDAPRSKFVRVRCPTGRDFCIPVPREMRSARQAVAWTYGFFNADEYQPEVRT